VAAPEVTQPQLPQLTASPVKPGEDLPDPLPAGARRVISTMAAAQMRKMMEGVVLFGTGKSAQLNGYSSGGKTGTAQKIDPATHRYNGSLHIASFAGFAPINNPVIAVSIILDSPKGAYYGAEVSAPVFTEVAQQVLEYLGVPHDIDLRPVTTVSKKELPVKEDDAEAQGENIQALYEAANDLPSDDPLRGAPAANPQPAPGEVKTASSPARQNSGAQPGNSPSLPAQASAQPAQPGPRPASNTVVVADVAQLRVPSLLGLSVRQVIEEAGSAGLEVEIAGSGTAREQAPAPGDMVAPGTKIVVRCAR
jgi:cell division protein FtsI (penicillin-binding protein 3)